MFGLISTRRYIEVLANGFPFSWERKGEEMGDKFPSEGKVDDFSKAFVSFRPTGGSRGPSVRMFTPTVIKGAPSTGKSGGLFFGRSREIKIQLNNPRHENEFGVTLNAVGLTLEAEVSDLGGFFFV